MKVTRIQSLRTTASRPIAQQAVGLRLPTLNKREGATVHQPDTQHNPRTMSATLILAAGFAISACGGGGGGAAETSIVAAAPSDSQSASSAPLEQSNFFYSGGSSSIATTSVGLLDSGYRALISDSTATATSSSVADNNASAVNPALVPTPDTPPVEPLAPSPEVAQAGRTQTLAASGIGEQAVAATTASTSSGTSAAANNLLNLLPGYKPVNVNAPKKSDVILSPRFDRAEAPSVARAYRATRTEWSYITNPTSIAALRTAVGPHVGTAMHNNEATAGNAGAAIDFNGNPIVAPWMVSWGAIWNTCAAPAGLKSLTDWATKLLALGANSIQLDGAGLQLESEYFGAGDFSPASLAGFGTWVDQQRRLGVVVPLTPAEAADYRGWLRTKHGVTSNATYMAKRDSLPSTPFWRAYITSTVTTCLGQLRTHIAAGSANAVPLSLNIHTPYPWGANAFLVPFADYVVAEVDSSHDDFSRLSFFSTWLRSEGRGWVPVFPIDNKAELRRKIAIAYAVGATPVIPWDLWIPPAEGSTAAPPRFFGAPADFGDLFAFVRSNALLFNDFEPLSRLNLVVYSDPPNTATVLAQLKRLSDLNVPYAPRIRTANWQLSSARLSPSVNKTFRLMNNSRYSATDTYGLIQNESDDVLRPLSVAVEVSADTQLVVTGKAGLSGKRVIHVLRGTEGSAMTGNVAFALNDWVLPAGVQFTVRVHRPGGTTAQLGTVMRRSDGRLAVSLADVREWALVEIDAVQ